MASDNATINKERLVGELAGAICHTLMSHPDSKQPCMVWTPAVTFKVKKCLEEHQDSKDLLQADIGELAKNLRTCVASLLLTFEFDHKFLHAIGPQIEEAVLKTIDRWKK